MASKPLTEFTDEKLEYAVPAVQVASDSNSDEELRTADKGYTDVIAELPEAEKRRILRKVDWHVIPILTLLYLVAFVDRSNIGNAKIVGMTKDLKMHGLQYNIAVTLCKFLDLQSWCRD